MSESKEKNKGSRKSALRGQEHGPQATEPGEIAGEVFVGSGDYFRGDLPDIAREEMLREKAGAEAEGELERIGDQLKQLRESGVEVTPDTHRDLFDAFAEARMRLLDSENITGREGRDSVDNFVSEVVQRTGLPEKLFKTRVRREPKPHVPQVQGPATVLPDGEKKISLESHKAGKLQLELQRVLTYAIRAAQTAAKKGEDPVDPLSDPEVKRIEEQIRQTINPGDKDIEALIRASEDITLLQDNSFDLEKLKAQAEAVRAEREATRSNSKETGELEKELKEAIEFGILDIARTPFGRRGKIRNPLDNSRAQAALRALEDAGVSEAGIRRLQGQFYAEFGFNWREWQERVRKERDETNAGIRRDRKKKEAGQDKFFKNANLGTIADAVEQTDLQDAASRALSRRSDYGDIADEEGEEMRRGGEISDEDLIRLQAERDVDAAIRRGGGLAGRRPALGSIPTAGKEDIVESAADQDDLELLREQERAYRKAALKREQEEEIRSDFYVGEAPAPEVSPEPEIRPEAGPAPDETVEPPVGRARSEAEVLKELEEARARLAEVENNPKRYGEEVLRDATERYDKARAEFVAGDIHKFVREQTALFEKRAEITGSFEKTRKIWKWLGEANLTKLGVKPWGMFSGIIYRGVNVRSVASGGLLALGALTLTPVGLLALGVRQLMAGAGAGFAAYELQRRWHETKLTKLTDEDIAGLADDEVAERIVQLAAYARVNHAWEVVRPAYEKLQARYEKALGKIIGKQPFDSERVKITAEIIREKEVKLARTEKEKEERRRLRGVIAGGATALGLPFIRTWLGYKDITESASSSRGSGLSASEAVRSKMEQPPGAAGSLPPVHEGMFQPPEAEDTLPPVREGMLQPQESPSASLPAHGGAFTPKEVTEVLPPVHEEMVAPIESVENIQEFRIRAKSGEGPIHEARKAIALYLDKKGASLSQEQRIWAEEELWKRTKKTLEAAGQLKEVYRPGDSIGFRRSEIDSVIGEVKERFGTTEKAAALRKNLNQFIDKVNWNRYEIKNGVGLWEADGGIRKVIKVPARALTGEAADPDAFLTAWNEAEEVRQFGSSAEPIEVTNVSGGTVEIHVNENPAGSVAATDAPAGAAAEGSDEAKTAAAEIAVQIPEAVARQTSALRKEYYDLIKNMEVNDLLKKRFFSLTKEQQWPIPKVDGEYPWVTNKPSHVRLMQYLRFQNRVREVLAGLNPDEAAGAKSIPVSKFIIKYLIAK